MCQLYFVHVASRLLLSFLKPDNQADILTNVFCPTLSTAIAIFL